MTRILMTSLAMAGHVRPGLPIARELSRRGHEVLWYTGRGYAAQVTAAGATFSAYPVELDVEEPAPSSDESVPTVPRQRLTALQDAIIRIFVEPIPAHAAYLDALFDDFRPDVVVSEQGFVAGTLVAERRGIPSVVFSVSPLGLSSRDTAPFGLGLPPSATALGRLRNGLLNRAMRHLVFRRAQRLAERIRREAGLPPLDAYFLDMGARTATRYLVPSVPEIEYPRSDLPANVEFVGAMVPRGLDAWTPPGWWDRLLLARAAGRPVVHVTQGTLATEPTNLLLPTVAALADEDVLVVATTGGADADEVLAETQRPANLVLDRFVPHTELLPLVDVMVTNGGFGGVQTALAHGVPLVGAGTTEDKAEVNARVEWVGAGIRLRTDRPSPGQIRGAVRQILGDPSYRAAARRLQAAYARRPGEPRVADVVLDLARRTESIH